MTITFMRTCASVAFSLLLPLTLTPALSQGQEGATPLTLLNAGEDVEEIPSIMLPSASQFIGRLEVIVDNASRWCTATFIDSNILLTAAHCVQANGTSNRYTIVQFKKEGGGIFNIKSGCVFLPSDWASVTDRYLRIRHDYAFLKTTTTVFGSPDSIATGNPYYKWVTLLGYPTMGGPVAVHAETQEDILHPRPLVSVRTSQLGFAQGTSGGPWIRDSNGRILSISSSFAIGIYDKTYMRIYGPTFEEGATALLQNAKDC